jgi:hypothetical protein
MNTRLCRAVLVAIVIFLLGLAQASATVTGEFRVAIDPDQIVTYAFQPSTSGPIKISATFKPIGSKLSVKLFRSDRIEPVNQIEGENPLELTFVHDALLPGISWKISIQNLSDRTLSGLVELTYPKANCKELAADYTLDLRYVNELVPLQEEQCAVMHRTLRALPEDLRRGIERIVAFPQDPEIAGQYISKTIRIYGDLQGARLARVFFHEIGHHGQFAHFTNEQQTLWADLHKRSDSDSDNFARLYGRTNQFEDFATVFEAYTDNTAEALSLAQSRHARGKMVYLEKIKFVASLFRHERNGSARTFIYRTESSFGEARILRASVAIDDENIPQIPNAPDWDEF